MSIRRPASGTSMSSPASDPRAEVTATGSTAGASDNQHQVILFCLQSEMGGSTAPAAQKGLELLAKFC